MTCDCESNLKIIREGFLDQLLIRGFIDRENYKDALKTFLERDRGIEESGEEGKIFYGVTPEKNTPKRKKNRKTNGDRKDRIDSEVQSEVGPISSPV